MRHQALHAVNHLDDVCTRLPVHDHHDRGLAVGEAERADVFDGIDDVADVGQAHRGAVAVSHDQRLVIFGLVGLVVGVELIALLRDVDAALGAVGIGAAERCANILQPDAVFEQRRREQFDPNRRQRSAADRDFADAFDLRQLLRQNGRGGVVKFGRHQRIRRQRVDQDRRGCRIELAVGRVAPQIGRQIGARRIDRRLHVARGAVDVRPMSNCRVIRAEPSVLAAEVISVTLAIWPRWRSSGLATVFATSAGLAPGKVA